MNLLSLPAVGISRTLPPISQNQTSSHHFWFHCTQQALNWQVPCRGIFSRYAQCSPSGRLEKGLDIAPQGLDWGREQKHLQEQLADRGLALALHFASSRWIYNQEKNNRWVHSIYLCKKVWVPSHLGKEIYSKKTQLCFLHPLQNNLWGLEHRAKRKTMGYVTVRCSGAAFLEWWRRQKREAETTSEINLKAEHGSVPGRGQNN